MTLFKNIRPLRRSGVLFLFDGPAPATPRGVDGEDGFLRIELLFPTFLPFPGCGVYSLQHRMIFSNRNT